MSMQKVKERAPKVKVAEAKINFAPIWIFPDRNSSWNSQMATKLSTKF